MVIDCKGGSVQYKVNLIEVLTEIETHRQEYNSNV